MDKGASSTLHGSLSNYIRAKIYAKEWPPHKRIPSEHQLMAEFEVSRGTVRKALRTLVDEGLLQQEHGRGTFVCEPAVTNQDGSRPFSFAASLVERGVSFRTDVLINRCVPAGADVARRLQIAEGDPVLRLRRVRCSEGRALMMLDSWTPVALCPGIEHVPFDEVSLSDAIERTAGRRIAFTSMLYSARVAGKDLAGIMSIAENAPVLNMEQVMLLDDGRPVEWGDTVLCAGQTIVGMARRTADTKIASEGEAPW